MCNVDVQNTCCEDKQRQHMECPSKEPFMSLYVIVILNCFKINMCCAHVGSGAKFFKDGLQHGKFLYNEFHEIYILQSIIYEFGPSGLNVCTLILHDEILPFYTTTSKWAPKNQLWQTLTS